MKILTSLIVGAATLSATAASSADLAERWPAKAPSAVVLAYSWTGFYAGVNAGYTWQNSKTRYDYLTSAPMDPNWQLVPAALGSSQGGFTGGGQVGYNIQSGNFVFGVEADIQYLGSKNKASQSTVVADDFQVGTVGISNHSSVEWLSTVRGRAGYAIDRTLVYATGGLAFGGVKSGTSISSAVADNDQAAVGLWSGNKSETRVGYAVGAGAEYALSQSISVKAEYLYYNLGKASYNVNPVIAAPDDEFLGAVAKRTVDGNIVRVGLNVKL